MAEMTGRKARIARKNGKPCYEQRTCDANGEVDSLNVQEVSKVKYCEVCSKNYELKVFCSNM